MANDRRSVVLRHSFVKMPSRIRPYEAADKATIVRLNTAVEELTNPMDEAHFGNLSDMCAHIIVAEENGQVVAFLMAFTDNTAYASPNYQWFCHRLKNFCYIGRIVVDSARRNSGIGKMLYANITQWANQENLHWLAVDINIAPPNPGSLLFHQRHNFMEVGRQTFGKQKTVSLQLCPIPAPK